MSAAATTPGSKQPPPSRCVNMNVGSYSAHMKLPNGRCIMSHVVVAGGHSWRVAFYPNGRLAGTTDSASLYLLLDDAGAVAEDVHVEYKFTLQEGGGRARFTSFRAAGAAGRRQRALGFERFISLHHLENLGFSKLDRFTIRCDFTVLPKDGGEPTVVTPPASLPERSSMTAPPPEPLAARTLPADLGRLLQTKEGADVVFEVSGKVFDAHKLVLAARSPVFKAEFSGPAKEESTGYIVILDMHPDAFEALLHYMYTDSLPEMTLSSREEGAVIAEGLLVAAGRYGLNDLKSLTENKMCSHIGVSTVLPMLALAEHHCCRKLRKMCMEFIASRKNTRAIMATGEVEHLVRSCPSVVEELIVEILDAREATPANPLIISIDSSIYIYALICIIPVALWALLCVLLL
ncbi:hypothetical protein ACP70R_014527 [Stipagrostis hirtigluma subsp. patula]